LNNIYTHIYFKYKYGEDQRTSQRDTGSQREDVRPQGKVEGAGSSVELSKKVLGWNQEHQGKQEGNQMHDYEAPVWSLW
tara:strand:- start:17979 stop:18215 length:237 start_codon:yes stop_codon:yes gene_type:complete